MRQISWRGQFDWLAFCGFSWRFVFSRLWCRRFIRGRYIGWYERFVGGRFIGGSCVSGSYVGSRFVGDSSVGGRFVGGRFRGQMV